MSTDLFTQGRFLAQRGEPLPPGASRELTAGYEEERGKVMTAAFSGKVSWNQEGNCIHVGNVEGGNQFSYRVDDPERAMAWLEAHHDELPPWIPFGQGFVEQAAQAGISARLVSMRTPTGTTFFTQGLGLGEPIHFDAGEELPRLALLVEQMKPLVEQGYCVVETDSSWPLPVGQKVQVADTIARVAAIQRSEHGSGGDIDRWYVILERPTIIAGSFRIAPGVNIAGDADEAQTC